MNIIFCKKIFRFFIEMNYIVSRETFADQFKTHPFNLKYSLRIQMFHMKHRLFQLDCSPNNPSNGIQYPMKSIAGYKYNRGHIMYNNWIPVFCPYK